TAKKSWRRQEKREFVFLDQRGVLRHFERIWISDDADAFDQGVPERDGRSEAVKKRQRRENRIFFFRVEKLAKLGNVTDDIAMREDHAFGFSGTAARKKNDGFVVTGALRDL